LRNRTIVFAQSGVAKLADRRRIDLRHNTCMLGGRLANSQITPRTCIGKRQIHENRFAIDANGKYGQQSPAHSGIARGVDAILEECAAAAYGCGEKGSF